MAEKTLAQLVVDLERIKDKSITTAVTAWLRKLR